jgi:hypothetical protein
LVWCTRHRGIIMKILILLLLILTSFASIDSEGFSKTISNEKSKQGKYKKKNQTPESEKKTKAATTVVESDTSEIEGVNESSPEAAPVERLFRNPVLVSGLSSGADAINRSINSLMESLFYNLMDNDIKHSLTGSAGIGLGLHRDVFQSENGAWVIVDKFGLGPFYGKELYRFNDVPVSLGASQSNDIFDIYLRTDPMRVSESKKLPFWRVAVNNWFGVLPLLEAILPPSFNANEMLCNQWWG